MAAERDYWVETVGRTHLYYTVRARSKEEALEKHSNGEGKYIGCNDEPDERICGVLLERPHVSWH
jgi:hypothetical protein